MVAVIDTVFVLAANFPNAINTREQSILATRASSMQMALDLHLGTCS